LNIDSARVATIRASFGLEDHCKAGNKPFRDDQG